MSYRSKNIILGIGIGLILASIVNINFGQRNLSIDDVKREAARYHLIVLEEGDIINAAPSPTPTATTIPTPTEKK